jgi:hypothetical protein
MTYNSASANINVSLFNVGLTNLKNILTIEVKVPKDRWNVSDNQFGIDGTKLKNNPFISKVGLLNEKNELMGVAKLSKPIRKDEDRDITLIFNIEL